MTFSAWSLVILAIPVLLLGEQLVKGIGVLSRFNIPAPIVGGLVIAAGVLALNIVLEQAVQFATRVEAPWWTWIVSTEWEWVTRPEKGVTLPFLVGFFTCIGLNASWELARRGSVLVVMFLGLAAVLVIIQNLVGLGLATVLGVDPLLGLMCGSVSMTGGHGTAMGFADVFEGAGLEGAAVIGMAAATFGLVMGGLIGSPTGGGLIRKNGLKSTAPRQTHLETPDEKESGILMDLRKLAGFGRQFLLHFALLLACIKLGAYVSHSIQHIGLTFPVYMGALLLGVAVRNVVDFRGGRWIRTEVVDTMGSALLGLFLASTMMGLNLMELAHAAGPMLIILSVQVMIVAVFARFATYWVMGRNFDAAVMAGGHCGFALGATPNAVANMKALVERFGPAPRAFLVLPIVGAFLIDVPNATIITIFLNIVTRGSADAGGG